MSQEVELGNISKQDKYQDVHVDMDENTCVICLEDLDDEHPRSIHFQCGHVFHLHCILTWIYNLYDKNADISCPVCRSIECHSTSSYYNVMKSLVGYNQQECNNNVEVHTRQHTNIVRVSSDENLELYDARLRKGFCRFMVCFAIITFGFISLWIYTFRSRS
jgi:hypothetical protein